MPQAHIFARGACQVIPHCRHPSVVFGQRCRIEVKDPHSIGTKITAEAAVSRYFRRQGGLIRCRGVVSATRVVPSTCAHVRTAWDLPLFPATAPPMSSRRHSSRVFQPDAVTRALTVTRQ